MFVVLAFGFVVGCAASEEPSAEDVSADALAQASAVDECVASEDAQADALAERAPADWLNTYRVMLAQAVKMEFPELAGINIRVREGGSASSFLGTSYGVGAFFRGPGARRYSIVVARKFKASHPSDASVYTLLVHELQHIYDYEAMSGKSLLGFTLRYAIPGGEFVPAYERATDLRAISRLHRSQHTNAPILMGEYRQWQYDHLGPLLVKVKKKNYLSPAEILQCDAALFDEDPLPQVCTVTSDLSRE